MKRRDIIMKMKKLLVLGLSAVMAAAMLTGCGGSDKKEEKSLTVTEGTLTMATNAYFPPYEYYEESDEIVGIDVEIAQAVADKLGLELKIDERARVAVCEKDDIAAAAAVSAVRAAVGDVFFVVEGDRSVAAVACLDEYPCFIYYHLSLSFRGYNGRAP